MPGFFGWMFGTETALAAIDRKLDLILKTVNGSAARLEALLKALFPPTIVFKFSSQKGAYNMPLTAPLNTKNERCFIIGFDDSTPPIAGAALAPGQTITLTSADPTIVDFTVDGTAGIDAEKVQSVLSATVVFKAIGGPVNVTATVLNADGSEAETVVDTVTVTSAVAGVARSIGELFEAGVSGA